MIDRLILWLLRRRVRLILDPVDWTTADEHHLKGFLRTNSGRKFSFCLQKLANQRNAAAVTTGTPFECGQAVGYSTVFQDLQTLSGATPFSSNDEDTAEQDDAESSSQ